MRVINDYLINPSYGSQLTIWDVARPANMVEIAHYIASGTGLCWDASPFLPSGNIIATMTSGGLYLFAPDYVRACYLEGHVTDSLTGNDLINVSVSILTTTKTASTNLVGDYKTGMRDTGTFDVRFIKSGYITKIISGVTLSTGVVTQLDVPMVPITTGITEMNSDNDITVQPNPFNDAVSIHINHAISNNGMQLKITDVSGRMLMQQTLFTQDSELNTTALNAAGIYWLQASDVDGYSKTLKLVKTK